MTSEIGASVLVVDDDPVFRLFVELALKGAGHSVVSQADGRAARDCIAELGAEAFSCVLTDYRMPGIDGLALIAWTAERDPSLASILVTAEGEKSLVERTMRSGALDFLDKPVDIAVLRRVVSSAVLATAQRRNAVQLRRSAEQAGRIQEWMLRSARPKDEIAIECCFHPKYQAGGDFLLHQRIGGNRDIILVTDVAGHDLGAAYLSAGFSGFATGLLEEGVPLDQVLERYNRFLLQSGFVEDGMLSIAVTGLVVDYDLGSMTAYSCGAPAPAWFGASGWLNRLEKDRSSPLGWFRDLAPAKASTPIPCSAVWLWTDGLEELAARLGASTYSVAHALFEARRGCSEPEWLSQAGDDILLARMWPCNRPDKPPDAACVPLLAESYASGQADEIDTLQAYWERSLSIALPHLPDNTRFDLLLCAREAVLNALKHGCRARQKVAFQIAYVPAERMLRVRVADPGRGHQFDAEQHASSGTMELPDAQRGLLLIRGLPTKTSISRNGAELTLDFALS